MGDMVLAIFMAEHPVEKSNATTARISDMGEVVTVGP
jgi:hypothetical protein